MGMDSVYGALTAHVTDLENPFQTQMLLLAPQMVQHDKMSEYRRIPVSEFHHQKY